MENSLGQYCINVRDLDRSVAFWEGVVGIPVQSRTEIPGAKEVVLQAEVGGSRIQLAQHDDNDGPIDMGTAVWPVTVAFIKDPDGYLIEFVQNHEGRRPALR
jgi:lactoylglutathione lyase